MKEKKPGQEIVLKIGKTKLNKKIKTARCIPDQDHVPPMPKHIDMQPMFIEMPIEDHVPHMPKH